MSVQESIQLFVAINVFTVGLSHLFHPKIWVGFFKDLHQKGNTGNILNAFISLGMGSFILAFHFIWEWPLLLVSLYGLLLTIKGTIYLVFPSVGLNMLSKIDDNSNKFRWAGVLLIAFSIFIFYRLTYYR